MTTSAATESTQTAGIDFLARRLRAVVPGVLLVEPRILRRVIKEDCDVRGLGLQVPHRKSYWTTRTRLLSIAERDELGVSRGRSVPRRVILLPRPDERMLTALDGGELLRRYWRLLFHVKLHLAFESLDRTRVRQRIEKLGAGSFEEARSVLIQENLLLCPADDQAVYIEFAALYLDLKHFAPELIQFCFPSIGDCACIDSLLAVDVDAEKILHGCRPEGATEARENLPAEASMDEAPPVAAAARAPVAADMQQALRRRAERASAAGNRVRAALLWARISRRASVAEAGATDHAWRRASAELLSLCTRLQSALRFDEAEVPAWQDALWPLLQRAALDGWWPVEARLLYDLQKVCLDHEQAIYEVDLVEWAVSLGQIPIKRRLPHQGLVRAVRHLHSALADLARTRIEAGAFQRLAQLLQAGLQHTEQRLRAVLRPHLPTVLDHVGLQPRNIPERVARDKLVEELLDRVVARGFLTLGDLRDAISRNNLRLPDLRGAGELIGGDPLIRANRTLAEKLTGIYHRGEIYLRWLQRFSSLAFGTRLGRWLTLFVVLPFGGAYLALDGSQHVVEIFVSEQTRHHLHFAAGPQLVALGTLFLALIHVPALRRGLVEFFSALGATLRWLVIGLPAMLTRTPLARWLGSSWAFQSFRRYLLHPCACAATVLAAAAWQGAAPAAMLLVGLAGFVAGLICFNTRVGRDLEESFVDALLRSWRRIRVDLIPGLFRLIVNVFRGLSDDIERAMYAVDEQLRFRTGESRLSLVWKPVVGLVWFAITYVVRFSINLLIEPQINPIKHFPVVTVSHKLILPIMITQVAPLLETSFALPTATAIMLATGVGALIPGIFGFLAWELKENWRLYRANQAATLQPVPLGPHGETLPRLLRWGFHSGTLPKLYAALRRALRRGRRAAFRRRQEELHHLDGAVRAFVERELLNLLQLSRGWKGRAVAVSRIRLGCNSIRIELAATADAPPGLTLDFEECAGRLAARWHGEWLSTLPSEQRDALLLGLAGMLRLAKIDTHENTPVTPLLWTSWVEAWQREQAIRRDGEALRPGPSHG
jgi:hypothetical protein